MSSFYFWFLVFFCLGQFPYPTSAFIAYDCAHKKINITTISLQDVAECDIPRPVIVTENVYGQLIQLSDAVLTHAYVCKINVFKQIFYCGMHSHVSLVRNGMRSYIHLAGPAQCKKLHEDGILMGFGAGQISAIRKNTTSYYTMTLAGSLKNDGTCSGVPYADEIGSWEDVVVIASLTITLSDYQATIENKYNKLFMPSGHTCMASEKYCINAELGEIVWDRPMKGLCGDTSHVAVYTGPMQRTSETMPDSTTKITYVLDTADRVLSLRETGKYTSCPLSMIQTEHPRLVIRLSDVHERPLFPTNVDVHSLDMMLYINTKFVYLDRTIGKTIGDMYYELELRRCLAERQSLRTLLSVAVLNPVEFAYAYMASPGYTATILGEVIHLAQCQPVEVRYRHTPRCYHELPVSYDNVSWFMSPRSHLLQVHGTEIPCESILIPQYRIAGHWFSLSPAMRSGSAPQELSPQKIPKWERKGSEHLMVAGIYTDEDLERLRMQLLHPSEKAAIENIVIQGITGQAIDMQGVDVTHMISARGLERVTTSVMEKMWGWFATVGQISSGFLGIYMCVMLLKFIVDTLLRGKMLYDVYGVSIKLIAAIWASISHYILRYPPPPANVELNGVAGCAAAEVPPDPSAPDPEGDLAEVEETDRKNAQVPAIYPHINPVPLNRYR
uniref:Glycoprotein n=1 Tax=Orthopteran chu-related virus OKIAV152 TaxID=2792595 RepID=A0A7T0M3K3_9VIRU|nr:glycoprotein [Orthopteran chu-related virus OKIAV152]